MGKKVYTDSELKIIEKLYKQYLRYVKDVIKEDIFFEKLEEIGFYELSSVKFSSRKSIFTACDRYVKYYIEEILKKDKDNFFELKKSRDLLAQITKDEDILSKIYCIYISYQNNAIDVDEYTRLVEEFDLSKLNKTDYTNIKSKMNKFKEYASFFAVNYLNLTEKEFENIGKNKKKIVLKLSDKKALPILENIYKHYLEYLNMFITEAELYDKVLASGIFLITEKTELDGNSIRNLIIEAVNYYFKDILGNSNKQLLELKNNSVLNLKKDTIKSLSKYNEEARNIMKIMFELIRDYYDLKVDYDTYLEVISDTDINKVTLTKLNYKLDRRVGLFKYYAKFYAVNFLRIEEDVYEERLLNADIYKKSYQYYMWFCKGKINISEFNTFETTFGIKAIDFAREYAKRNNLMNEFEIVSLYKQKDKYIRKVKNSKNYRFIITLDRNFILSDYAEMVDDYNLDLIKIRKECFDYLIVAYPKINSCTFENKLNELRRKVDMVYDVLLRQKNILGNEVIDKEALIYEFIDGDYTINEFVESKGMDLKTFFELLLQVDKQSFDKIKDKFNVDSIDDCLLVIFNINAVVKGIKFGINTKYTNKTKFELFDYYKLLSSNYSEYNKCLEFAEIILDKYDYQVLDTFIKNNINISISDEENAILSMRVVEDEKELNNNEKISIINVMKLHGVPITRKLFNQALRRYLDGELITTRRII